MLLSRCGPFLLASLAVGLVVWTRFFVTWKYMAWLFAILFAVGLLFDWKHSAWGEQEKGEQHLISVGWFLLGVLPMLFSLFEAWANYYVHLWSAGPLLPYSDAGGYVNGAKWLWTFGQLGEWAARRPLGICLMSAALGVTGQNYQTALILLSLLAGISTFFAARETWRAGGPAAAILYVSLCYFAMRQWLPLFLTETPGYILGSIGYTFLLSGFRLGFFRRALFGFGFLILAVTARAGAMFAMPLLAVYLIYYFHRNFRDTFRKSIAIAAVTGALLALSPLLVMRLAPSGTAYQGSLSYTLYGIAVGGNWTSVSVDHPEINQMTSDGEKARYVYSLFRKKISEQPSLFFSTLLRNCFAAIRNSDEVFFGLMRPVPPAFPGILALIAFCMSILPALRRQGPWVVLVPIAIGVLLSAPFLVDGGLRVFAATVPFQAALAAGAIPLTILMLQRLRLRMAPIAQKGGAVGPAEVQNTTATFPWAESAFAILILATVSIFPLIASVRPVSPALLLWSQAKEKGSRKEVVFYYTPGSGILLGHEQRRAGVMNVAVQSVAYAPMFGRELRAPEHFAAGDYLYHAFFLQEPEYGNVFVRFRSVPEVQPGYLKVLVSLLEERDGSFLYVAENYTRVDPLAQSAQ